MSIHVSNVQRGDNVIRECQNRDLARQGKRKEKAAETSVRRPRSPASPELTLRRRERETRKMRRSSLQAVTPKRAARPRRGTRRESGGERESRKGSSTARRWRSIRSVAVHLRATLFQLVPADLSFPILSLVAFGPSFSAARCYGNCCCSAFSTRLTGFHCIRVTQCRLKLT